MADKNTLDKLKPCPFCGSEAIMQTFKTAAEKDARFRVKCSSCFCETNWDNFSAEDAKELWNRRVDDG